MPNRGKIPNCPQCGKPMLIRTARKGKFADQQFYGCSGFPECREILPIEKISRERKYESDNEKQEIFTERQAPLNPFNRKD